MPSLAVLILGVVFLTQLVAWVGKSVLQDLAFSLYSSIFFSSVVAKQRALRKQILLDKADLSKTSSQDEFSKWAKLKRKVDKGLADLEQTNTTLNTAKSTFNSRFSSLIWILTTGAQFFLVWWYRKQPVFYLPEGWVPGPLLWLLSFPSAPKGSVSSAAWGTVCKRVLTTGEDIVREFLLPPSIPNAPFPAGAGGFPGMFGAPSGFAGPGAGAGTGAKVEPIIEETLD